MLVLQFGFCNGYSPLVPRDWFFHVGGEGASVSVCWFRGRGRGGWVPCFLHVGWVIFEREAGG